LAAFNSSRNSARLIDLEVSESASSNIAYNASSVKAGLPDFMYVLNSKKDSYPFGASVSIEMKRSLLESVISRSVLAFSMATLNS